MVADRTATNAELLQAGIDAWRRDGIDAILEYFSPDIEWVSPREWPGDHFFCGYEGVRALEKIWTDLFDGYDLETVEIRETPTGALAFLIQRGAIKGTGVPIEQRVAWIVTTADGRMTRVQAYFSWEEALEAAES